MATIRGSAVAPDIYRITSDHLGAPLSVMDDNGVVVWEWDGREPFGFQMPNQDPDGDSNYFYLNMRFAGQWFDYETGLYHNGFRDYHPKVGRYIQSDPIGLEGGWNTYAYTENNPVNFVDPYGLKIHFIGGDANTEANIRSALSKSYLATFMLNHLDESKRHYVVKISGEDNKYAPEDAKNGYRRTIYWNPNRRLQCTITGNIVAPEILFAHELTHAYRDDLGRLDRIGVPGTRGMIKKRIYGTKDITEEHIATSYENQVADELGLLKRRDYFRTRVLP